MAAPGAPFNRGVFVGSNSALFAGQSLGDIYLSNFFAPPTILAPFHARLTVEVIGPSIIGFIIEITITAPGNPMAVWVPAPVWLMFQLQVVHIQNGVPFAAAPLMFVARPPFGLVPMIVVAHPAEVLVFHPFPPPFNVFHYHNHHHRPRNQHVGMPPLVLPPAAVWRTINRVLRYSSYGNRLQFFRRAG